MKRLPDVCKPGITERVLMLHPLALMILCDVMIWAEEHGLPFVVTDAATTEEEDTALKRTSATHRECRAFDVSAKGWGMIQLEACKQYFSKKYEGYAAIGKDGVPNLVYVHDAGTGSHMHFQLSRKYAMPMIA